LGCSKPDATFEWRVSDQFIFVLYADIAWTLAIDHGAQATKQRLLRQDAKGVPVMDRFNPQLPTLSWVKGCDSSAP
jgi:hypothetical protein